MHFKVLSTKTKKINKITGTFTIHPIPLFRPVGQCGRTSLCSIGVCTMVTQNTELRLLLMVSFVDKCMKGKCPVYLNDLFQINVGSSSRRLNMVTQPKYTSNSMYGSTSLRYQGDKLWNEVDNLRQ